MSYVLEALRRAEADRHRGEVPGLHAPGPAALGAAAAPAGRSRLPWLIAALALLALIAALAAGLWRGGWRAPVLPSEPPARVEIRTDAAPAAVAPAADQDAAAGPPAAAPVPPATAADRPGEASAGSPVPPPVALPEPVRRLPAPPATTATTAADGPLPAPPPMQFGGAFDSPDPKARMLIINGQVWREGDEPTPGWVLERITLHAAQFRVQGRGAVLLPYDGGPPRRP